MQNDNAGGWPDAAHINALMDEAGQAFLARIPSGSYPEWRNARAEAVIQLFATQIAAREAAAWCAALSLAKARVRGWWHLHEGGRIAADLDKLTPPASFAAALDAVRREARAKEREAIAAMFDTLWPTPQWNEPNVAAAIRARGDNSHE